MKIKSLVLSLVLIASVIIPCAVTAESATVLITKGNELYDAGQYQEALVAYNESIALDPNQARAWAGQGYTFNAVGDYQDALNSLEQAVRIFPGYGKAMLEKGHALYGLQKYGDAIVAYENATQIYPEYAYQGYYGMARSYQAQKEYTKALQYYEKALELKPDYAPGWNLKGETLVALNRNSEAEAAFDKALSLSPGYGPAVQNKKNLPGQSVQPGMILTSAAGTTGQVTPRVTQPVTTRETAAPGKTKAPLSGGLVCLAAGIAAGAMVIGRRL